MKNIMQRYYELFFLFSKILNSCLSWQVRARLIHCNMQFAPAFQLLFAGNFVDWVLQIENSSDHFLLINSSSVDLQNTNEFLKFEDVIMPIFET